MSKRVFKKKTKFNKAVRSDAKQSKQIAKNAKAIKMLKKAPEVKRVKSFRNWAASAMGFTEYDLNVLVQGTTGITRIGDVIQLRNLELNVMLEENGLDTAFRILVIMDSQNNNSIAVTPSANLFEHTSTNLRMINSTFNRDFVGKDKRYQIIFDSGAKLVKNGQGTGVYIRRIRKLLNHKVHYSSNLGTTADIIDKDLTLLFVGNDLNANWQFSASLAFVDS